MNDTPFNYLLSLHKAELFSPNNWKLLCENEVTLYHFLKTSYIDFDKLPSFPEHLFKNFAFSSLIMTFYNPPINKIPEEFFTNPIFLVEIANKAIFNLSKIPHKFFTPNFLDWYVNTKYKEKDFLTYIPNYLLSEDLAIKAIEYKASNITYLDSKYLNDISFIQKLTPGFQSKVFPYCAGDVLSDIDIVSNAIEHEPSNYQHVLEPMDSIENFYSLLEINPSIFAYSNRNIKADFHCSLDSIRHNPANITYCHKTLLNDAEFFLACYDNIGDKISPYLLHFGENIFSDITCVKNILPLLIQSDRLSYIKEPILSDKDIMLETIIKSPSFYNNIGKSLLFDLKFFNDIYNGIQELCINEPTKHSFYEMTTTLFKNIPDDCLNDYCYLINLYDNHKDNFILNVYPFISTKETPIMRELIDVKLNGNHFDDYFSKIKHMIILDAQMNEANKHKHKENLAIKKI